MNELKPITGSMNNFSTFSTGLFASFLMYGASIFAQGSLVQFTTSGMGNLSTIEQQKFLNFQQDTFSQAVYLIRLKNPLTNVLNGVITMNIPLLGSDSVVIAELEEVEYSDTSKYKMSLTLRSHPGYMNVIQTASGVRSAFIQTGSRFFNIMPIGSGYSVLQEVNTTAGGYGGCSVYYMPGEPDEEVLYPCEEENNTCEAVIDILVWVGQDAYPWFQSNDPTFSTISLGVEQAINTAIANSDIPNKKVRIVKILDNLNFNYGLITNNCNELLNAIRMQATNQREKFRADLTLFITAKDMSCGAGAAGVLNTCSGSAQAYYAFIERKYLTNPRWVAAHEIGHLFSMHHDIGQDICPHDALSDNACGHGWITGGQITQNTLMQTIPIPEDGNVRILHYSNPEVFYNGSATGTPTAYNAKILRNKGCTVENYIETRTWDVWPLMSPIDCPEPVPIQLTAVVEQPNIPGVIIPVVPAAIPTSGTPPYTFEWRWSYSPIFNPGTLIGTGNPQPFHPSYNPLTNAVFIQLKAMSGDNKVLFRIKKRTYIHCRESSQVNSQILSESKIEVFPNPTDGNLNIKLPSGASINNWSTQILDQLGVQRLAKQNQSESGQIKIETGFLSPGVYICRLRYDNEQVSFKFLKL